MAFVPKGIGRAIKPRIDVAAFEVDADPRANAATGIGRVAAFGEVDAAGRQVDIAIGGAADIEALVVVLVYAIVDAVLVYAIARTMPAGGVFDFVIGGAPAGWR